MLDECTGFPLGSKIGRLNAFRRLVRRQTLRPLQVLRSELIPAHDLKLSEVEYGGRPIIISVVRALESTRDGVDKGTSWNAASLKLAAPMG
jgi:hypothetical protein